MKWFKNMKIAAKLLTGFLLVAMIASFIGVMGIININKINDNDSLLYEQNTESIVYSTNAAVAYQRARYRALEMGATGDVNLRNDDIDKIDDFLKIADDNLSLYEKAIATEAGRDQYNALIQAWSQYKNYLTTAVSYAKAGELDKAAAIVLNDSRDLGLALNELFETLADSNNAAAASRNEENNIQARSSTILMIALASAGVVLAIGLGIIIARLVSKPLEKMAVVSEKLARGEMDIDLHINTKDEVGTLASAFMSLIETIRKLIADIGDLSGAAIEGRLSTRVDAGRYQGDFKKILEGVNHTLDAVIEPVQEAAEVLQKMSDGDLNVSVTGDFSGDHALIKDALNKTIDNIKGYIGEISSVLAEMSTGNLDVEITSDFKGDFIELKRSINSIADALNKTLTEINNAAGQVASGTKQVSEGSQTISQGATEQASSIEELSATVAQIAAQTRQNAKNANTANGLATSASKDASDGNGQMKQLLKAMVEINESSENISKIIKVIDDIAFQTNILALNAAVEAARAGIHGKGFAVVAEEVRNLAQKSANAAKETTTLIEGSIKKVEAGTQIADHTALALQNIVNGVEKAASLVGEIATASNEQATGIAQVNGGIEQLSTVVQTNSATAEEAAAASEELSSQAELLSSMVSRFQLRGDDRVVKLMQRDEGKSLRSKDRRVERSSIVLNDLEFGKY